MQSFIQDIRFAIRVLVKGYGVTLIAVITLAMGIGANTAIFSLVDAILFKPLPFSEPDRLVNLWNTNVQISSDRIPVTVEDFQDWREQATSFQEMGLYRFESVNATGDGKPERLRALRCDSSLLPTFGLPASLGRFFAEEEIQPGEDRVAILTDRYWRTRYAGRQDVVGESITIDGIEHIVIGVLPRDLSKIWNQTHLWLPLAFNPDEVDRENHAYGAIARLAPGVSLTSAQTEMDNIVARLAEEYPDSNASVGIRLAPIRELMIDKESQLAFVFLLFAVAFVLLIACTNVANLLLAKSSARQREMAIRSALGAGKWRIVRQLISESSVLALVGAGLGVVLAIWGLDILVASLPERVALNADIHVSERSLIFTALASLVAALMFGLAPAFRASRVNLVDSLKEGMQSTSASSSRRRGRDLLVVGQIAMAMALVLCTGLMTKSFLNILDVPTHFNRDGLMTMTVDLPEYDYEEEHDLTAFYREATERLRAIPGVRSATASDGNPIGNMNRIELKVDGYEAPSDEIKIWAFTNYVETDYFETMQIPLIDGRFLSSLDGEDGQAVAIVSEVLATRFWPDESAIGNRFQLGTDETWLTIVGIVPSIRVSLIDPAPGLEVTIPISQSPTRQMTFYVRTDGDTQMLISPMKSAIGEIDVNLPVSNVLTMNQVVIDNIGAYGTLVGILITLAGIALVLSCVGLYGVIAYTVELRTRELGIRIALGAKAGDVLRLVIWRGVVITLIGVVIGLGLAAALAMLLKNVMFGVSPTDPTTYLQISTVLVLVAIVACYIPARRATKVDPMVALRYE